MYMHSTDDGLEEYASYVTSSIKHKYILHSKLQFSSLIKHSSSSYLYHLYTFC